MKAQRGFGLLTLLITITLLAAIVAMVVYAVHLDQIIREKFEGQRWDIPAKVFARPIELKRDNALNPNDLIAELALLNYKENSNINRSGTYTFKDGAILIHTRGFDFGDKVVPEQIVSVEISNDIISSVKSNKADPSGKTYLEPVLIGGIYPHHNEDRVLIKLKDTPQSLIDALISTEDRNFYQHYGISVRGLARALLNNITGNKIQGGSTLTQQLVKNFYLTSERTYSRKAREAAMSVLLELHYSKDEILETYLNEVNLGQNGNYSINGYGLASQFYFGRPLKELNIAQHAFLAGLVQGPSLYNPWKNPEKAIKRRNLVLQNMLNQGFISQQQYNNEVKRPLGILSKPTLSSARFPDFMDLVRRQLQSEYAIQDLDKQGLRIFTTLDPIVQMRVEQRFKNAVKSLSANLQGALIISNPQNGEIQVAVGSTQDFTGFNRIVDAKRQVGSLLKPVIYLNALESEKYTWASTVEDRAIEIPLDSSSNWRPKNYAGGEYGTVPLTKALANSYNLSAVQLANELTVEHFIQKLHQLGISKNLHIPNYPSVWLGAVEMTPMDILKLYQTIAMGGYRTSPKAIRSVVNQQGHLVENYRGKIVQAIQPEYAYLLNYGLQQVTKSGTAKAVNGHFSSTLGLAGKTGTTNDGRDSWFAGYSGNHVAVVWVGYDDNRVTGLTGGTGALPVWISVMKQLPQKAVNIPQPSNVVWGWLDREGNISNAHCGGSYVPYIEHFLSKQLSSCASNSHSQSQERDETPSYEPIESSSVKYPTAPEVVEPSPAEPEDNDRESLESLSKILEQQYQ